MKHLPDAHILKLGNRESKGISTLQKPDKIFFENTCIANALQPNAKIGTIRETFFINQLANAGHHVHLAQQGDFLVDSSYTIEIGGKNKKRDQITTLKNASLVKDDIEHGFAKTIPL